MLDSNFRIVLMNKLTIKSTYITVFSVCKTKMAKCAIVIVGNVNKSYKSFSEELVELWRQTCFVSQDGIFVIGQEGNRCTSIISQVLSCGVNCIKTHKHLHIHGLYEVKRNIDHLGISCCHIVIPESIKQYYSDICAELFTPAYHIVFCVSEHLSIDYSEAKNIEQSIVNYLQDVPSDPVVIHRSELIPTSFLHGYTSRQGGISTYSDQASLNMCFSLKKKDGRVVVNENRNRLSRALLFDPEKFFLAKAVHGKDVWVYGDEEPKSYDGIVTNSPGVVIAAPGADCNMLIFVDVVTKACGVAHAGWKGILKGIVQETVSSMIRKYGTNPKDLIVTIGPSLSVCCCEFGVEESKQFLSIHTDCVVWKENLPKPYLDLRLAVKVLLEQLGVLPQNIDDGKIPGSTLDICTKCDPDQRFFSYRRVGPQFGNQVCFVGLIS